MKCYGVRVRHVKKGAEPENNVWGGAMQGRPGVSL